MPAVQSVRSVQKTLNLIRKRREYGALPSLSVSGRLDKPTQDAIRAFQHEHNSFVGSRELGETGALDWDTRTALSWWKEVLESRG